VAGGGQEGQVAAGDGGEGGAATRVRRCFSLSLFQEKERGGKQAAGR